MFSDTWKLRFEIIVKISLDGQSNTMETYSDAIMMILLMISEHWIK